MMFSKYLPRVVCAFSLASMALLATSALAQDKMVFKSLADLDNCAGKFSYNTGVCLEPLQAYAKANPKELFAIGKRARLQFRHWVALQFFEPAMGKSPSAAQCADEDVGLAVISGLATPTGDVPQTAALRIFTGPCYAVLRPVIEKEVVSSNGAGYVARHACPVFATNGVKLPACEPKVEAAAPPPKPDVLPVVDLATAKFGLIKVFAGSEGVRVTVADIPAVPGAFAIRVDGVRGDFNGKTQVHQQTPGGTGFDYWTLIDGKRWNTLIERGGSYKNYQTYVPGTRDAIPVAYSDRDSKAVTEATLRK
jgi:hypothetical protein